LPLASHYCLVDQAEPGSGAMPPKFAAPDRCR
jgi:hypothetical protein